MKLTEKFYKELHEELMKYSQALSGSEEEKAREDENVYVECYVGEYYVTAMVHFKVVLHDESFDHLFGTWHDPNPQMEIEGYDYLEDVHVYESDDKDAQEVGEFDFRAFMRQFEEDRYVNFKKGDAATYYGRDVTFIAYNKLNTELLVQTTEGYQMYVSTGSIKKKNKTATEPK